MSFRGFNPFVSSTGINTHSDSAHNRRPPTYASSATTAPTYTANEPATTSAYDPSERVRAWSATLPDASSVAPPDSDTSFNEVESSITDTVSVGGTSVEVTRPAGTRYIYYRIYAEDGAIPSVNPVYTDDPSLGRIMAKIVAPPHTAISLKLCFSSVENIDEKIYTKLFVAASSQTPMDDDGSVSILGHPGPGPGCTPNEPMAFVAMSSGASIRRLDGRKPQAVLLPPQEGPTPFETQYLYYRIYEKGGAALAKQPADSNDPSVGRVSIDSIPPPHTASTFMRCISKAEELHGWRRSQLFTSISSQSPIGEAHVSILTSDRPGSTPEDPMAFVLPKFTKQMRMTATTTSGNHDPNWLSYTVGDILEIAHEEPRNQSYVQNGTTYQYPAYEAVNDAGKVGFVGPCHVQPC